MIRKELLFIVDLLFLPFLLLKIKKAGNYNILERSKALIFLLIVSLYLNISFLTYYMQFYSTIFFRYDFVKYTGIFNYQICDIYDFLLTKIQQEGVSPSDINRMKDWLGEKLDNRATEDNLTGIGKGKNLIMIQVESLQNFVIGRSYHGREITPNLNRLVKEGIYFKSIYDQTAAGNSSDATLLANSSLFPSRKGAVAYLYFQNYFDSLPKILREEGYATATLHAYKKNFWNSLAFEKSLGFEYQFYEDAYVITDKIGGRLEGLSDKSFFLQSIEKIEQLPTPFYAFLRTLSTHALFDHITKDIDDFPLYNLEGEILGSYVRSMHYVDSTCAVNALC
jgi:phosphoglycerol transferase MdoB-like AlkP superfamily enzyme